MQRNMDGNIMTKFSGANAIEINLAWNGNTRYVYTGSDITFTLIFFWSVCYNWHGVL